MSDSNSGSTHLTLLPKVIALKTQVAEILERAEAPKKRASSRKGQLLPTEDVEQAIIRMASKMAEANGVSEAELAQLSVLFALFEPRACYISHFHSGSETLQVSTVRGRYDERILAAKPGQGASGRAFASGEVVREEGLVASPLQAANGPTGTLTFIDPKHMITDALLRALSAQVSAASEVARLRDDTLRRTKDLETALSGLKTIEKGREDLLSHLSHNLKTPLTTIKAYLPMLMNGSLGAISPRQEKALNACDRNADRLLKMIDDLLMMSRLRAGRMALEERPFGLKSLIEEVFQSLCPVAEQSNLKIVLHPSPEVYVRGDREHISEAAYNLIDHALHQAKENSEVEITLKMAQTGWVEFSVINRGPVLLAEELERVFETLRPVKSTMLGNHATPGRKSDIGLGLPVAAKIIRLHGGRVDASSSEQAGTCFRFYLPVFAGALNAPVAVRAPAEGGILLVEDDADCREVLSEVLLGEGYRVHAASSAAEAKTILAEQRPAMVLLDLRLSDDDGRTVLHFIRTSETLNDTSVFIISGASDAAEMASGRGVDRIDGFFEKPLQLSKLLHTVASVVAPSA